LGVFFRIFALILKTTDQPVMRLSGNCEPVAGAKKT